MDTVVPTIYADFNNADRQGRLRLITRGSLDDIAAQGIVLANGLKLIVRDGELSAEGEIVFSDEEDIWVVKIDWSKL